MNDWAMFHSRLTKYWNKYSLLLKHTDWLRKCMNKKVLPKGIRLSFNVATGSENYSDFQKI